MPYTSSLPSQLNASIPLGGQPGSEPLTCEGWMMWWFCLECMLLAFFSVAACSLSLEAAHTCWLTISSQPAPLEASFSNNSLSLAPTQYGEGFFCASSLPPKASMLSPDPVRADGKPRIELGDWWTSQSDSQLSNSQMHGMF